MNYTINIFNVIERYNIVYRCNIEASEAIRRKSRLFCLPTENFDILWNDYNRNYLTHEKVIELQNIHDEHLKKLVPYFKTIIDINTEIIKYKTVEDFITKNSETDNFLVSSDIAKNVIETFLSEKLFTKNNRENWWQNDIIINKNTEEAIIKIKKCIDIQSKKLSTENLKACFDKNSQTQIESEKTKVFNSVLYLLKENNFEPEAKNTYTTPIELLTKTNWIKKEVATGGGNIEEPPQNFHPLLAPVAQYVVDLQHVNIPKIKEKFIALNDKGIQKILENLIALRIISSDKDLRVLVQNQSGLNFIFDLNHIKYTSYIKDPLPPPPPKDVSQIKDKLQTYYTANNYDFITKSQLADLYNTFQNDFSVTKIENIVSSFLDKNDLIPEQKPKGVSFREQHCSTNWVHKKAAPAFHWSVYGKYISYLTLIGFIILCAYYGAKSLNSGIVYRTIAYDGANIRNTTNTGSDESIKEKITYGEPFKIKHETDMVSGEGGMWLKQDGWFSDRYVSAKIFVTEPDFYILESAFADETTRQAIQTVKTRKAIIDYFKRNNLFGILDAGKYEEVYKHPNPNTEVWQVQCQPWQSGVLNSIIYPKATDPHPKFTDFGFIVTNKNNNIKKFALYRFDAITEEPIFVGEEDATGYTVVNSVSIRSNGTLSVNMH